LTGLAKPVQVVAQGSDDNEIINIAALAVVETQLREKESKIQQRMKEEVV